MEMVNPYGAPESRVDGLVNANAANQAERQTSLQFFLSWHGRISRKAFWLYGLLPLLIIQGVTGLVVEIATRAQPMVGLLLNLVIGFVISWCQSVLSIKRWHDRGRSGWFSMMTSVPGLTLVIIGALVSLVPAYASLRFWLVWVLIPLCVTALWTFIEIGCLRGTVGDNRFGPDPTHTY